MAEFIGTFALVFAGTGSICMDRLSGGQVGLLGIALAHGLAVTTMAYAYGPVSGGHFNPAVTLALRLHGRIETVKAVLYVGCQLLGAAVAGLTLASILRAHPELASSTPFLGACGLGAVGFKAGTLAEAIAAFFLMSTVYATSVDARGREASAPAAIGMTYALGILAIGPLTGASLNPARAFGPAVATGHWDHWYVYWIGPLAGTVGASLLQEKLALNPR